MKYGSGLKSERGGWGGLADAFTYHEAAERTPTHPPLPATNEGLQEAGSSLAETIKQTEIHPRVQVCIMQNESTRTFSATVRISVPVYVNLGSFLLGIN